MTPDQSNSLGLEVGTSKDVFNKALDFFSSVELWILEHNASKISFSVTLLSGLSLVFMTDDVAHYLPDNPGLRSFTQRTSIMLAISLIFISAIIQALQIRHAEKVSKLHNDLIEANRNISALQEDNRRLNGQIDQSMCNMELLCDDYLQGIADGPLKFGKIPNCHERITLYAYEPKGYFFPIGRYSCHPEYRKKRRQNYPEDEGAIAKTWENNWYFVKDYPDPERQPDRYQKRSKKDGVSENIINGIRMKSRLYCGYRISDTGGRNHIAVLITESTCSERYTEEELKNIFDEKKGEYLVDLTERVSEWIRSFKDTEERGF